MPTEGQSVPGIGYFRRFEAVEREATSRACSVQECWPAQAYCRVRLRSAPSARVAESSSRMPVTAYGNGPFYFQMSQAPSPELPHLRGFRKRPHHHRGYETRRARRALAHAQKNEPLGLSTAQQASRRSKTGPSGQKVSAPKSRALSIGYHCEMQCMTRMIDRQASPGVEVATRGGIAGATEREGSGLPWNSTSASDLLGTGFGL